MTGKIFINYRREESGHVAGRLHDRLAQAFGRDNLFMDVDNIPVGVDFVTHLNDQVAACDAVLVVIGPNWLKAKDKAGQRRLHQPDDFVAIEIAAALTRDIRVIPVLVDGARMPRVSELPDALKLLARRQAAEVRHVNFAQDAETLVARMRKSLGDKTLVKGGPEAVGDKAAVVGDLERLAVQEREAKAEAKAEAKRKADEAEQQRLATAQAEQERQVRAAAEAQRQANIRAEQERQKQAEADARQQAELEARRLEAKRRDEEEQRQAEAETRHAEEERSRQGAESKRRADEEARRKVAEAEARPIEVGDAGRKLKGKRYARLAAIVGAMAVVAVAVFLIALAALNTTLEHREAEWQQRRVEQQRRTEQEARAWAESESKRLAGQKERPLLLATTGIGHNDRGDYIQAIAMFNEAIRLDPKLVLAITNRGVAYEKMGDYDRAISDYDNAIQISPKYAYAFCKRGLAKLRMNDSSGNADVAKANQLDTRQTCGDAKSDGL